MLRQLQVRAVSSITPPHLEIWIARWQWESPNREGAILAVCGLLRFAARSHEQFAKNDIGDKIVRIQQFGMRGADGASVSSALGRRRPICYNCDPFDRRSAGTAIGRLRSPRGLLVVSHRLIIWREVLTPISDSMIQSLGLQLGACALHL